MRIVFHNLLLCSDSTMLHYYSTVYVPTRVGLSNYNVQFILTAHCVTLLPPSLSLSLFLSFSLSLFLSQCISSSQQQMGRHVITTCRQLAVCIYKARAILESII